jgi:hypothetical protein
LIAISPIIKIKNVKNIFFWEKNEWFISSPLDKEIWGRWFGQNDWKFNQYRVQYVNFKLIYNDMAFSPNLIEISIFLKLISTGPFTKMLKNRCTSM